MESRFGLELISDISFNFGDPLSFHQEADNARDKNPIDIKTLQQCVCSARYVGGGGGGGGAGG